jgi:hypothetical protein
MNRSGGGPREGVEYPLVEWHGAQSVGSDVQAADQAEIAALARARLDVAPVDSHRRGAEEMLAPRSALVGDAAKVDPVFGVDPLQELPQMLEQIFEVRAAVEVEEFDGAGGGVDRPRARRVRQSRAASGKGRLRTKQVP